MHLLGCADPKTLYTCLPVYKYSMSMVLFLLATAIKLKKVDFFAAAISSAGRIKQLVESDVKEGVTINDGC
jgi:hypothetical protein